MTTFLIILVSILATLLIVVNTIHILIRVSDNTDLIIAVLYMAGTSIIMTIWISLQCLRYIKEGISLF